LKKLIFIITLIFYTSYADKGDSLETLIHQYRTGKPIDPPFFKISGHLARYYRFQDRDRSFQILDSADIFAKDFMPLAEAGDIYNVYGNLYFDIGDYSKALENYYKCLENAIAVEDLGAAAFSYSDVAYCYYSLEFFKIAKYYYQKAFEYAFMDGVVEPAYPRSHISISLALTLGNLGELDSAYHYLKIGEEIRKKDGDPVKLAQIYSYYGMISLRNERDYKKSKDFFNKAIEIYNSTPDHQDWSESLAYIYNYLAKTQFASGNLDSAFYYNNLSAENFKKVLKYRLPSVYSLNAQIFTQTGNLDSAVYYGELAIQKAEEVGILNEIKNTYEIMYDLYQKTGQYRKSNEYLRKFYQVKDSMLSSKYLNAINTFETTLQLREKESERAYLEKLNIIQTIGLFLILMLAIGIIYLLYNRSKLQKQNLEKIEKANDELNEANLTKDKFFSIIAHDLKNPVSAFKGSLEMMHEQYQLFDESDRKEMIEELYNSAKSMQELLNNLLTWSRAQGGKVQYDPNEVDPCFLAENVKSLTLQIAQNKRINVVVDCNMKSMKADANLLNIVLLNLVVNAIKFSNENSKVFVRIKKLSNNILFEVQDEGVGMNETEVKKLFKLETSFSKQGTNKESGTGLGLIICQEFVNLHNGRIWVESELGLGTSFFFEIPQ
jgi:signal transduction histidine kinase